MGRGRGKGSMELERALEEELEAAWEAAWEAEGAEAVAVAVVAAAGEGVWADWGFGLRWCAGWCFGCWPKNFASRRAVLRAG
jgi:hypothetical protein